MVDVNLTGMFYCARAAVRADEGAGPAGRADHQQRLDLRACPAPARRPPYTATKHAVSGLTKSISLDCRAFDICVGQIDIGNALTEMAAKMQTGVMQANGTIAKEPLIDVQLVANTVLYMDSLPLDANILFLTVMANQMPFVGRG